MTRYQLAFFIALIGLLLASVIGYAQQTGYDFLITGARIVDGTFLQRRCHHGVAPFLLDALYSDIESMQHGEAIAAERAITDTRANANQPRI